MDALTRLNERLHAAMEEDLLLTLEALTALDLDEAAARFGALERALTAHAAVEEELALPAFARLGPFPRGAAPAVFEGDHRILERTLRACREHLDAWADRGVARRSLVLGLDPFMRLRHVLEHHGLREEQHLYPALEEALSEAERARLAAALDEASE